MNRWFNTSTKFLAMTTLFAVSLQFAAGGAAAQKVFKSEMPDAAATKQEAPAKWQNVVLPDEKKIAPDMENSISELEFGRRADKMQKVIITFRENQDSLTNAEKGDKTGILLVDKANNLSAKLASVNGRLKNSFEQIGVVSAELPLSQIREIVKNPDVAYISPDLPIVSTGYVESVTGALQARAAVAGTTLDGTGIGVAILDSGIDTYHKLADTSPTHPGAVFTKNFTGVTADARQLRSRNARRFDFKRRQRAVAFL